MSDMNEKAIEAAADKLLAHWRDRFPVNAYAWPGTPKNWAYETTKFFAAIPHLRTQEEIARDWQPTAENVNALPEPLRKYVAALETECDPAGTIRENYRLRDENTGLRTECERLSSAAGQEWRDISSAPKDSRFIDLWHKKQGRLANCRWLKNDLPNKAGAWFAQSGGRAFNMGLDDEFSHWMSLPTPPVVTKVSK